MVAEAAGRSKVSKPLRIPANPFCALACCLSASVSLAGAHARSCWASPAEDIAGDLLLQRGTAKISGAQSIMPAEDAEEKPAAHGEGAPYEHRQKGEPLPEMRLSCGSKSLALASGVVALFSELSFAALGFGPAVMYEICWQFFYIIGVGSGHLEEAVWNSLIMSSGVAVVQAFLLRRHMNVRVALLMTVPLVMGLPVGTLLLEMYSSARWLKKLLGAFFIIMIAVQGAHGADTKPRIEDLSARTCSCAAFAALAGGLSRGLFGVSAPVSVLLLFFSIDKDLWRLVNAIYRIAIFLVQGTMLVGHLRPERTCAPMYAALVLGGALGMVLGNMAAPYISTADLQRWIVFFLAAAGFLMLSNGYRELELAAAIFSVLALLAMTVSACLLRKKEGEEVSKHASLKLMPTAK
uniref:Uncharacterized protein n=1 Tax=Alexandrium monilatum TaxID=311494 RepID=A0A7S4V188_9DINO|mmetsp:Transcript_32854/g.102575  ORF Transcript_32854/g.102575 Transcript_32854/m.102575 type:complete len:408 (+) Transcript_32854:97-1320(+)